MMSGMTIKNLKIRHALKNLTLSLDSQEKVKAEERKCEMSE